MNKCILSGNLTRDPELRQTPQGISVARFTIAVRRNYKDESGVYPADFISCVAWRNTAEFLSKYFHKGSGIQLCGNIQSRSWDDQDGQKHYATEVVAENVEFFGGKSETSRPDDNTADGFDDSLEGFDDIPTDENDLPY